MPLAVASFAEGLWVPPGSGAAEIPSAIDSRIVARLGGAPLDFSAMLHHARGVGGPALRRLTFHERADLLKRLAIALTERKQTLYDLAADTGATRQDNVIDIDGGIGTLFAYASRGRRELPAEGFAMDGGVEPLSKGGTFVGRHIFTPLRGAALHINAYNFPCWGMLEKFAPSFLAGVPVITKPASATAYVAHAAARIMLESGCLPPGALQFVAGSAEGLLDHLTGQDVLAFTGSLATSEKLRNHPTVSRHAVRFIAERDSLNAALLGPDAAPGTPEFDLFVREVVREMTVKAGQKCTAIRRVIVPRRHEDAVIEALRAQLARIVVGDPRREDVAMGPLVSLAQRADVRAQIGKIRSEAELAFGDPEHCAPHHADAERGAFLSPILLLSRNPREARHPHVTEAFGPVSTVMPYGDLGEAIALAERGEGSLVASIFTHDPEVASTLMLGLAPFHGRLLCVDRDCAAEQTGHGSPLPGLVHGGPGRAGGGEELGGLRGVHHYMQRTALQGSPAMLARVTRSWIPGAAETTPPAHPFRYDFDQLAIGHTIHTEARAITLADIEHFADFSGDRFYAHMDEEAARANPFFPGRVAHGYLILAFAAGLFVDPAPGPLLANYGLDNLRFLQPVSPGDAIRVRLTVKQKSPARRPEYGEVRWDVEVFNQRDETVAKYDLLTMSARA